MIRIAQRIADTALLLSVLAGVDSRSPIALEGTGAEFASPLTTTGLHGLRIAWTPDLGGLVPVDAAVTEALLPEVKIFEELGATLEQACPDLSGADEVFRIRRAWQLELAYGSLLDEHRALMKPDAVWNIEGGRALTGPDIGRAERLHAALHQRLHEFFQYFDVLLAPVSQVVPFDADLVYPQSVAGVEMTDYLEWMGACSLITVTGCPALSVPAAFTPDGLPVGLQIIGPHRQDRTVLEIGRAFELACGAGSRRPPV